MISAPLSPRLTASSVLALLVTLLALRAVTRTSNFPGLASRHLLTADDKGGLRERASGAGKGTGDNAAANSASAQERAENKKDGDNKGGGGSGAHRRRPPMPRTVHLITLGPSKKYWPALIGHTTKLAGRQGYAVRVWRDDDGLGLVDRTYPELRPAYDRLRQAAEKNPQQQARVSDLLRLLVLHTEGGVYLDLDMIPCGGLDSLIGPGTEPPAISFPFTNSEYSSVANGAMASPPGHPVLSLAIESIVTNPFSHNENVLQATGPVMIAHAIKTYSLANGLALPDVYDGDNVPIPKGRTRMWHRSADVRLGTFAYDGVWRDDARPEDEAELNLWHLGIASWMEDWRRKARWDSVCEDKPELIEAWLRGGCDADDHVQFRQCGKDEAMGGRRKVEVGLEEKNEQHSSAA